MSEVECGVTHLCVEYFSLDWFSMILLLLLGAWSVSKACFRCGETVAIGVGRQQHDHPITNNAYGYHRLLRCRIGGGGAVSIR